MKLIKIIIIAFIFILPSQVARAQFFLTGDDPSYIKWMETSTPNYRIIYPQGLDSLAYEYGRSLEKYRIDVGRSTGMIPGEYIRGKMPVVLHNQSAYSNGSVAWAPKRIDLYTNPQADTPEPMPWVKMLSIHESRHDSQMQFGLRSTSKYCGWVIGEMFNGLMAGIHPGKIFLEGDAVIAETAFTNSGRGRTGEFLNYYMIAFDQGDYRTVHRWLLGSQRYYTPDYYSLGYLYLSGMRAIYDAPEYMETYLKYCGRVPIDLMGRSTVAKKYSGLNFGKSFFAVAQYYNKIWQANIAERGAFMPMNELSPEPKRYTTYEGNVASDDAILSIKSSIDRPTKLIAIGADGKEKSAGAFSTTTSKLTYDKVSKRTYWSELITDVRWDLAGRSVIRYSESGSRRKHNLTRKGRFYNPAVSDKGSVAAVEHLDDARTRISVIDAENGSTLASYPAPDSLQIVEIDWISEDRICFSGVSDSGYGLYEYDLKNRSIKPVLGARPVVISNLRTDGSEAYFESDLGGVTELYKLDYASGETFRITNTRYGSRYHVLTDSSEVIFSANQHDGKLLYKGALPEAVKVDFTKDAYIYPVAEILSEQEKRLAKADTLKPATDFEFSKPRRSRNIINVHSWAPAYINVDKVKAMSFENIYEAVSLGATAMSQNIRGSLLSQIGYSAHKNPQNNKIWKHSAHAKFTYSGLYPVFEASIDFNDRNSVQYNYSNTLYDGELYTAGMSPVVTSNPYLNANISAYIPMNFSSGGWIRGFIPKVSYNISNDVYNTNTTIKTLYPDIVNGNHMSDFSHSEQNGYKFNNAINVSVRAYTMRPTASSGVYPRLGIGAEAGYYHSFSLNGILSPVAYGLIYGYVPGLFGGQGVKIAAYTQHSTATNNLFRASLSNMLPRGVAKNNAALQYLTQNADWQYKFTLDYAIPIFIGDLAPLMKFTYIKRLVLTPHFDYTYCSAGSLISGGATLQLDLKAILWINVPLSVGVTYSYNGGCLFNKMKESGVNIGRHFVGPVFSVSLPN